MDCKSREENDERQRKLVREIASWDYKWLRGDPGEAVRLNG